jgi:hypothetical protein
MEEGILAWLLEVLSERWRLWVVLILGITAAVIIGLGALHYGDNIPWFQITEEFSKILLTAIFAGAILKVLVLEGYFSTALSKIVYEDRGLERLREDERKSLWHKLTILVYAPFLHRSLRSNGQNQELSALVRNLSESVVSNFDYNQNFYQKDWRRTYEIEWVPDSADKRVLVTEAFRSKMTPFNRSESIKWITTRTAEAHLDIHDYKSSDIEIKINGRDPDPNEFTSDVIDGQEERRTYLLFGHERYDVYRRRTIEWQVDSDPGFSMTASTLIDGGSIEVSNRASNLRIVVKEVGGTRMFSSSDDTIVEPNGRYFAEIKTILLPGQGFQLTFIRETPPEDLALKSRAPEGT